MPIRSNEFQQLITLIEGALSPVGAKVTSSAEIIEPTSKAKREVDILIEYTVGEHQIRIAIECRDYRRPVNVTWIDSLYGKFRDLSVNKVVAVSKLGFSAAALNKARELGIETLTLKQAKEIDWPYSLPTIRKLDIENILPCLDNVRVILDKEVMNEHLAQENLPELIVIDCNSDDIIGKLGDLVNKIINTQEFFNSLMMKPPTKNETRFEVKIGFGNKNFIVTSSDGRHARLLCLILKGTCKRIYQRPQIRHMKYGDTFVAHAQQEFLNNTVDFVFTPVGTDKVRVSCGIRKPNKKRRE